ncbi:MAG TPA: preprotein translocase subunit YajC [Steroidobacteraceae bacterium]|nr:preprotein translocase subunit YajC [Steroidobacteraceae bacterium]
MSLLISTAHAQTAGAAPQGPGMMNFIILPLMIVVFYFLLIRPQQKRHKEHQALLSKLAPGDEVVTSGGLLGRITDVGEGFITVEIADGVRIKVQRQQITQLVPKGTYKSA